ncbi:hypothetical protein ACQY0O_008456 [Thecaphora frezii]
MLSLTGARVLLRSSSRALPSFASSSSSSASAPSFLASTRQPFHTCLAHHDSASSSSSTDSTSTSPSSSSSASAEASAEAAPRIKRKRATPRPKDVIEAERAAKLAARQARQEAKRLRDEEKARKLAAAARGRSLRALKASYDSPSQHATDDDELEASPSYTDLEAFSRMRYPHLAPREEWRKHFSVSKSNHTHLRYFCANHDTAKRIVDAIQIPKHLPDGLKATIIEGYPGPGTITSEFLKLDCVEKVVALERSPCYRDGLHALQQQLEQQGQPGRLDVFNGSAYNWETYSEIVTAGLLSHLQNRIPFDAESTVDISNDAVVPYGHADLAWQSKSPIFFFAQLPNTVHGEQLFAQIVHAIASRLWLFRYGRIRLGFVCGEALARRCLAQAGDRNNRAKLGTTVQCLADVEIHIDSEHFSPHHHHFFPHTLAIGPRVPVSSGHIPNSNPSTGLTRTGMCMMTLVPKQKPMLDQRDIEAFEFVTRNLFVLKSKSVHEALTHIAPGGQNVLKMLTKDRVAQGLIRDDEVIDPNTKVYDLTNAQWTSLARTFEKWPFRPEVSFRGADRAPLRHPPPLF